jgi:hypothetical protein
LQQIEVHLALAQQERDCLQRSVLIEAGALAYGDRQMEEIPPNTPIEMQIEVLDILAKAE